MEEQEEALKRALQTETSTNRSTDPWMSSLSAFWTIVKFALQFDRFHFRDESPLIVREDCTDHGEHGVTEASDVHDVRSLASLNRLVRLRIDVGSLPLDCKREQTCNARRPIWLSAFFDLTFHLFKKHRLWTTAWRIVRSPCWFARVSWTIRSITSRSANWTSAPVA